MTSDADKWKENFRKFLYENAGQQSAYSLEEADAALHKYFDKLVKGEKPNAADAALFYKIRNGALSILTVKFGVTAEDAIDTAYEIGVAKNHDYGLENITKHGVIGLVVRLSDKVSRAVNLLGGAEASVSDEKAKDTILDMVNYATYAVMLCNGTWL